MLVKKGLPSGKLWQEVDKNVKTLKKEMDKQRLSVLCVALFKISVHTRMEIKPGSACKVLNSESAC